MQEGLKVTVVISENHGYQVIRQLQMNRAGRSFGNEFRARDDATHRLEGDYITIDFAQNAASMGARTWHVTTPDALEQALVEARDEARSCVIVVETEPHRYLPGAGVWWDVAPAEATQRPRHRRAPHRLRERARPVAAVLLLRAMSDEHEQRGIRSDSSLIGPQFAHSLSTEGRASMNVTIGSAPDSWGVWFPSDERQTPWHRFLDEIAEAGYEWTELGPYGYLPTDPETLRAELAKRNLRITGATVIADLEHRTVGRRWSGRYAAAARSPTRSAASSSC